MKPILLVLALLLSTACSTSVTSPDGSLSADEVSEALRDMLGRSIARSIAFASVKDGFYADPRLEIESPPGTEKMQIRLRDLGLGAQLDAAVVQLNRAAELSASRAKRPFIKAITALDIDYPFAILNAGEDAATQLLRKESAAALYAELEADVVNALHETGAQRSFDALVERYNALPFVVDVDADIATYLSEKTVDGLFILMAQQESQIRNIPAARSTRLMRRVFGSLD